MQLNVKVFANLFRAILLLFIIATIAIVLLWKYNKPAIDNFQNYLIAKYTAYYQDEFNQCLALLNEDNTEGIKAVEEFLATTKNIKRQDRIYPLKREAYARISKALSEKGDRAGASKWLEQWVALDERDIKAQYSLASLMIGTSDLSKKGAIKLKALHQKVPATRLYTELNIDVLLTNKRYADAFLLLETFIATSESLAQKKWQVFWSTGNSFNVSQSVKIIPSYGADNSMEMMFHLPPGVTKVRIDPPPSVPLVISNLNATRTAPMLDRQLEIARLPLTLHQMKLSGASLTSSSEKDPSFAWDIPNPLKDNITAWLLTANVQVTLPPLYTRLLRPDIAELIKSELLDRGEHAALQRFTLLFAQQSGLSL
jgi:hypothetical protein